MAKGKQTSLADDEIRFTFEGEDYFAKLDAAAICAFEDEADCSIFEIAWRLSAGPAQWPKLSTLGTLIAAGLRANHPGIDQVTGTKMIGDPVVQQRLSQVIGFEASANDQV